MQSTSFEKRAPLTITSQGSEKVYTHKLRQIMKDRVITLIRLTCRYATIRNFGCETLIGIQMTRMAEERDSILRIRAKVDSFDEWEESLDARPSVEPENPLDSWVLLCAPQKPVRVQDISSKLAPQEFRCSNFASRLVQFLHLYAGTKINVKRLQSCSVSLFFFYLPNY